MEPTMPQTTPTKAFVETVFVEDHKISCNGGGGALGHPLVWYEFGASGDAVCEYCGIHFVRKDGPADKSR